MKCVHRFLYIKAEFTIEELHTCIHCWLTSMFVFRYVRKLLIYNVHSCMDEKLSCTRLPDSPISHALKSTECHSDAACHMFVMTARVELENAHCTPIAI